MDDISLSSVSADNSLDLSDGSDDSASGYSQYASQAMQLGSELAYAAFAPAPAPVAYSPVAYSPGGGPYPAPGVSGVSGKTFMLLALAVLVLLGLWAAFGS